MASLLHETIINVGADRAWSALRQVSLAHRLFADVLIDGRLDGDIRTVTFANGMVVRERVIDINDERRRLAYSVISGTPMTHHNASMQLIPEGEARCRFVWIADFLPDEFAEQMLPLVQQGTDALKRNIERGAA
ncbi:SRPBCC family protein [Sphingomonas sp. NSE70-1]|uniref:SRPBCC family protein n=1 Tax=Sphingomonas caseinilyticus TaxID=2908205 RepID=A0ABT0RVL9_9SPHN|nr:SRPBCC family protein [Sphingomonas caseinilyticus]MCL6699080.1 SRPBCC family protein [Sphingomonas caseinilyticus]